MNHTEKRIARIAVPRTLTTVNGHSSGVERRAGTESESSGPWVVCRSPVRAMASSRSCAASATGFSPGGRPGPRARTGRPPGPAPAGPPGAPERTRGTPPRRPRRSPGRGRSAAGCRGPTRVSRRGRTPSRRGRDGEGVGVDEHVLGVEVAVHAGSAGGRRRGGPGRGRRRLPGPPSLPWTSRAAPRGRPPRWAGPWRPPAADRSSASGR